MQDAKKTDMPAKDGAESRRFVPGDMVRHFKRQYADKNSAMYLYKIIAFAEHTENKERLAVYRALYAPFKICARPYGMFMSEVDREKYPDAEQRYRFELVSEIEKRQFCRPLKKREDDRQGAREQERVLIYNSTCYAMAAAFFIGMLLYSNFNFNFLESIGGAVLVASVVEIPCILLRRLGVRTGTYTESAAAERFDDGSDERKVFEYPFTEDDIIVQDGAYVENENSADWEYFEYQFDDDRKQRKAGDKS
ncbi:MAG: DUF1653 domain-containing protein [Acidaminococcaceae bacterium]|nr:DUF1653 domain-containing protein [Acidaminococcaceae bacterium]